MRPRLLDLCCKAGGCSKGYADAGFEVVGVDLEPQPNYPYEFHQADGLTFPLDGFDVVHASPPCPGYSTLAAMHPGRRWPLLIESFRHRLRSNHAPFIIENVETAPLTDGWTLFGLYGVTLCGSSFGLGARGRYLRRHRRFESNVPLVGLPCNHQGEAVGVYGHGGHSGKHRMAYAAEAREALGIDWMTRDEMTQAIPPVFTAFLGEQLLASLGYEVPA